MYRLDVVLVCNFIHVGSFCLFFFSYIIKALYNLFSVYATVRLPTVAKGLEETENFLAMQVSLFFVSSYFRLYMLFLYSIFFRLKRSMSLLKTINNLVLFSLLLSIMCKSFRQAWEK